MHSKNSWPEQRSDASRSHFFYKLLSRLTKGRNDPARSAARARKFIGYYRPYVPLLVADLCCAVLVAASAIALPLCASYITTRLPELAQADDALFQILSMGALMLGVFLVQSLATYFVDYQGHVMGARIEADVRKELFEHCQKLSFGFYDRQRVGQLMSRISNDSLWLGELFHHGPEDIAISVLKFGGAMVVLTIIDPVLAGLIAVLVPFAVLYASHFNGRMSVALKPARSISRRSTNALRTRWAESGWCSRLPTRRRNCAASRQRTRTSFAAAPLAIAARLCFGSAWTALRNW